MVTIWALEGNCDTSRRKYEDYRYELLHLLHTVQYNRSLPVAVRHSEMSLVLKYPQIGLSPKRYVNSFQMWPVQKLQIRTTWLSLREVNSQSVSCLRCLKLCVFKDTWICLKHTVVLDYLWVCYPFLKRELETTSPFSACRTIKCKPPVIEINYIQ